MYKIITVKELAKVLANDLQDGEIKTCYDVTLDTTTDDPCGWYRLGVMYIADGYYLYMAYYGGGFMDTLAEELVYHDFSNEYSVEEIESWLSEINSDENGDGQHFCIELTDKNRRLFQ